ncbi:AmmeMemoRadiSam system protein B [Breznakiella homolactica]|uniref:AmmeMemoRadiSam system protein B n=1 Tax=Breznakiella homolactica TaxID=2798577 RepID=A0A7T8BBT6_9SPIR|nr:AmmeMemoRadiSam system protein B [Breznakiella homolactica]QQO10922.1 AmmeMemoRadiSam system protein B [Breznakiella homolactica]
MSVQDVYPEAKIRSAVVAGLFYPEEKQDITSELCSFGLESGTGARAAAVLAPHAAWNLSGAAAAAAFLRTTGRVPKKKGSSGVSQVVILGSVHNGPEQGLFVSDSDYFETPLGLLRVNKALCNDLISCSTLFELNDIPHLRDHSMEVLFPFVQYIFPEASIIPVLLGGSRPVLISALAKALRIVFEPIMENTLFVISTNAAVSENAEEAAEEAALFIRLVSEKEPKPLLDAFRRRKISACGAPVTAALLGSGLLGGRAVHSSPDSVICIKDEDTQSVYYYAGISFE